MLGVPLDPCTGIPRDAPAALITSHAAADPSTIDWLKKDPRAPVLLSPAAEKALPPELLKDRPVGRLTWKADPRELMDLPREALDPLRAPLVGALFSRDIHLSAPGRVGFYLFREIQSDLNESGEYPRLYIVLENFADSPAEIALGAAGRTVRMDRAIVLPPSRKDEVRCVRDGDSERLTIPARTMVSFPFERP